MAKDGNAPPMDTESIEHLELVRKGKARKFAMICKGVTIVSLVLYKKGSLEKYKKEAKEAGRGQFYFGVVEGKGQNIKFKLARADGFDKEPVKTVLLKQFLTEHSGFKFKPEFEIVEEIGPVIDDDDPLAATFLELKPRAERAATAHPDRAGAINALCQEISRLLDEDASSEAEGKIADLRKLLDGLAGTGPTESGATTAPPSTERQKWEDARQKWVDRVEKVLSDQNAPQAPQVRTVWTYANERAEAGDYAKAIGALDRLGPILEDVGPSVDEYREIYEGLLETLPGDIRQFARTDAERAEKLTRIVTAAQGLAAQGNYAKAFEFLNQAAETLAKLKSAAATDEASRVIPENVVADRKKFVQSRWQQAMQQVHVEVDKLRAAINSTVPDENGDDLSAEIAAALDEFVDEFNNAILGAEGATSSNLTPLDRALQATKDFRKEVESDTLIQHLESAKLALGVDINVRNELLAAIDEMQNRLQAVK